MGNSVYSLHRKINYFCDTCVILDFSSYLFEELLRALPHGLERGEVQLLHFDGAARLLGDLLGGRLRLVGVAAEYDDPGAALADVLCSLLADAGVGA